MMLLTLEPAEVSVCGRTEVPAVMIGIMARPTPMFRTASHHSMSPRGVSTVMWAIRYEPAATVSSPIMTGYRGPNTS